MDCGKRKYEQIFSSENKAFTAAVESFQRICQRLRLQHKMITCFECDKLVRILHKWQRSNRGITPKFFWRVWEKPRKFSDSIYRMNRLTFLTTGISCIFLNHHLYPDTFSADFLGRSITNCQGSITKIWHQRIHFNYVVRTWITYN